MASNPLGVLTPVLQQVRCYATVISATVRNAYILFIVYTSLPVYSKVYSSGTVNSIESPCKSFSEVFF